MNISILVNIFIVDNDTITDRMYTDQRIVFT